MKRNSCLFWVVWVVLNVSCSSIRERFIIMSKYSEKRISRTHSFFFFCCFVSQICPTFVCFFLNFNINIFRKWKTTKWDSWKIVNSFEMLHLNGMSIQINKYINKIQCIQLKKTCTFIGIIMISLNLILKKIEKIK